MARVDVDALKKKLDKVVLLTNSLGITQNLW